MKKYLALTFFVIISVVSHAQNASWIIPRIIYVGDHATLVVSLPGTENTGDIVLTAQSPYFPKDADIDFHRIVLERRITGSRLLVEFTAFAPGLLELPVIEIGGEYFAGLTVTVNSLIDTSGMLVLSRPASSLAMPGTSFMLYGTMAAIVFLFLLILWFAVKGRNLMQVWIKKWKMRLLFTSMRNIEKRMHKALLKGADKRNILDKLSNEFRTFLSILTNNNCRAMTAREFETLPQLFPGNEYTSAFLIDFFNRCDEVRFSGAELDSQTVIQLLDDLRLYITALEKTGRKKAPEKIAA